MWEDKEQVFVSSLFSSGFAPWAERGFAWSSDRVLSDEGKSRVTCEHVRRSTADPFS
jgi:hypothetical protein